jgi:DNA-binding GntR family transcriptional regulator
MVFTGLPWGYPRANLAHVSSIHRFNILRLNIVAALKIRDPIAAYHEMANHLIQIELSTKEALEDSQVTEINRLGP